MSDRDRIKRKNLINHFRNPQSLFNKDSITGVIDGVVGLLQDLPGHGVHAVTKTIMHFEELSVESLQVRHGSSMMRHFWMTVRPAKGLLFHRVHLTYKIVLQN